MCFPLLAAIPAWVGTAASVAGAAVSAYGTYASGQAQAQSYRNQAAYAERNALMENQKGTYDLTRQSDANDRQLASMRGQYLSSGIALDGSAVDVLSDSATQASLDEQAIKYGTKVRSDNSMFEAKLARSNAKSASAGGMLGALGTMVGGLAQTANTLQQRTMISNPYQSYDPWAGFR